MTNEKFHIKKASHFKSQIVQWQVWSGPYTFLGIARRYKIPWRTVFIRMISILKIRKATRTLRDILFKNALLFLNQSQIPSTLLYSIVFWRHCLVVIFVSLVKYGPSALLVYIKHSVEIWKLQDDTVNMMGAIPHKLRQSRIQQFLSILGMEILRNIYGEYQMILPYIFCSSKVFAAVRHVVRCCCHQLIFLRSSSEQCGSTSLFSFF